MAEPARVEQHVSPPPRPQFISCGNCAYPVPEGQATCPSCGTAVEEQTRSAPATGGGIVANLAADAPLDEPWAWVSKREWLPYAIGSGWLALWLLLYGVEVRPAGFSKLALLSGGALVLASAWLLVHVLLSGLRSLPLGLALAWVLGFGAFQWSNLVLGNHATLVVWVVWLGLALWIHFVTAIGLRRLVANRTLVSARQRRIGHRVSLLAAVLPPAAAALYMLHKHPAPTLLTAIEYGVSVFVPSAVWSLPVTAPTYFLSRWLHASATATAEIGTGQE
jgi:hypothetical protein